MYQDPIQIKIVAIGDGSVGKTCILVSYTTDKFPETYIPTVFENYTSQIEVDNQMVSLTLWDTAGQETYNKLRTLSYGQADVFFIVFSVTERTSFENALNKWLPELNNEAGAGVPKIFVANKIDMRKQDDHEHIQKATGEALAKEKGVKYVECSALTSVGLKDVFEEGVRAGLKFKSLEIQKSQVHSEINQKEEKSPCLNCNIM